MGRTLVAISCVAAMINEEPPVVPRGSSTRVLKPSGHPGNGLLLAAFGPRLTRTL